MGVQHDIWSVDAWRDTQHAEWKEDDVPPASGNACLVLGKKKEVTTVNSDVASLSVFVERGRPIRR